MLADRRDADLEDDDRHGDREHPIAERTDPFETPLGRDLVVRDRRPGFGRFRPLHWPSIAPARTSADRVQAEAPEYRVRPNRHHHRVNTRRAMAKPVASASVSGVRRLVSASAGTVTAKAIGTRNVSEIRNQPG